jgi:hypothetical protein
LGDEIANKAKTRDWCDYRSPAPPSVPLRNDNQDSLSRDANCGSLPRGLPAADRAGLVLDLNAGRVRLDGRWLAATVIWLRHFTCWDSRSASARRPTRGRARRTSPSRP